MNEVWKTLVVDLGAKCLRISGEKGKVPQRVTLELYFEKLGIYKSDKMGQCISLKYHAMATN